MNSDSYFPSIVENLLNGEQDWRNIQDIIKLSIRALADVVRTQGTTIRELEKQIPSKLSKTEFFIEINKKTDKTFVVENLNEFKKEIRNELFELNSKILNKISLEDFKIFSNEKINKEEFFGYLDGIRKEQGKLVDELSERAENAWVSNKIFEKEIEKVSNEIKEYSRLDEVEQLTKNFNQTVEFKFNLLQEYQKSELVKKADTSLFYKLEESFNDLNAKVLFLSKKIALEIQSKSDQAEVKKIVEKFSAKTDDLENNLKAQSEMIENTTKKLDSLEKAWLSQFSDLQKNFKSISESKEKLQKNFESIQQNFENYDKNLETLHTKILFQSETLNTLNSIKISKEDLNFSIFHITELVNLKLNSNEFYETVYKLRSEISSKQDFSDFEKWKTVIFENLKKIETDLLVKGNIKDLCVLLDMKANFEDVNHALSAIHNELDQKTGKDEFCFSISKQSNTLKMLNKGNYTGRWLWTSKNLLKSNIIPWELQTININSENFIWEENAGCIFLTNGGFYEVTISIFATKNASISLLINGEIILSSIGSNFVVTNHSGKLKNSGMIGTSLQEYLNLPDKARISINVNESGQGFLNLRRL